MHEVPQWHCKRYRKLDVEPRCRNFRLENRDFPFVAAIKKKT